MKDQETLDTKFGKLQITKKFSKKRTMELPRHFTHEKACAMSEEQRVRRQKTHSISGKRATDNRKERGGEGRGGSMQSYQYHERLRQ